MMSYLGEWIKNIVLLIFLATFLDLILPNTELRRYVKLVVGLLLILMILSPILHLFQFDYDRVLYSIDQLLLERGSNIQANIDQEQKKMNELQESLLLEEVASKWEEEMKQGIEQSFPIRIEEIKLSLSHTNGDAAVQGVFLSARTQDENSRVQGVYQAEQSNPVPAVEIKPIEPVKIQVKQARNLTENQAENTAEQKKLEKDVLKYMQNEWNISVDKISFSWRGG